MEKKFLKLRGLILVIITSLIFTACSKDSNPEEDIIGTWTIKSTEITAMVGNKTLEQYLIDEFGLTAAEAEQWVDPYLSMFESGLTGPITIKSDNTYTANLGGEPDNGTWSLSADGKKLTIDSAYDVPMVLDIVELTSNKLILKIVESDYDDDLEETLTINIEVTCNKE